MKMTKSELFTHIANVVTIALIVECFLCAMLLVNKYGRDTCFERIEETTQQVSRMFVHHMEEDENKLTVFADILAANSSNPEELLQTYMKNFCTTQDFSAVCIHRRNGTIVSYGDHPHDLVQLPSFQEEVARLPYVSQVLGEGKNPEDRCIYLAVPVVRGGETIAVLYGYIKLDKFPEMISSAAYGGAGQYYIVDGDTGDFLMDEYHGELNNIYDGSMGTRESKPGYEIDHMYHGVKAGGSGYYVFLSQRTGEWYYTYYMPIGINNWSMQMTIDEPTAIQSHRNINRMLMLLGTTVIVLMIIHVLTLMEQERRNKKKDKDVLHMSQFINGVQRALINAHSNPDYVSQALKLVAEETRAETVVLMSFGDKIITDVQYWPSKDKANVMEMLGRNVQEEFPNIFDSLTAMESVYYHAGIETLELSDHAAQMFARLKVSNAMMVPIMDNVGALKGVLAAVNVEAGLTDCSVLEAVTYDFFMSITNRENHAIIKRMGEVDYLTNVKNRNSYESEIARYAAMDGETLWCVFVDVNGLHDVNNTQGHKAGDRMLCAVAEAMKRQFGEQFTYRLGGDEFVAFGVNGSAEMYHKKKKQLMAELAAKNYYVSVGFEGVSKNEHDLFDVGAVVAAAEAIMYREKWEYYEKHHIPSERGHFPKMMTQE